MQQKTAESGRDKHLTMLGVSPKREGINQTDGSPHPKIPFTTPQPA